MYAPVVKPQGEVTNVAFRDAITMLSQAVTTRLINKEELDKKGLTI